MRSLIFKGKRLDNGEWVEGGTIVQFWDNGKLSIYIPAFGDLCTCTHDGETDAIIAMEQTLLHKVDPATVRQYTGMLDKNDTPIYEHDIVRIRGNQSVPDWKDVDYIAQIVFLDGGFCAIDGTEEEHGFRRYALARRDFDLEVLGNIHDSPELLAEDKDDYSSHSQFM